jgi:type I restriction enzyme M protein
MNPMDARSHNASSPIDHRFEAMLFSAHSILRDTDGMHPDEALDELCKLLQLKLIDEKTNSKNSAFRDFAKSPPESVKEVLVAGLNKSRDLGDEAIQLKASPASVTQLVKLLSKWSLEDMSADIRGRAFQKVLGTTYRADLGQYFTPHPIVELLVASVDPSGLESVIDPFCGSGHFLTRAHAHMQSNPGLSPRNCTNHLVGLEINERMVRIARTDAKLSSSEYFKTLHTNSLLPFSDLSGIEEASFDVVVTNPPFGSAISSEAVARLGPFELARGNSAPLEILGLERSVQLLKPNGRLAIVLPEGILNGTRLQYVRSWAQKNLQIQAIVSFPRTAFSPYGANIATCAIIGRRRGQECRDSDPDVLCISLENIGYDASGRSTPNSEIEHATSALRAALVQVKS